MDYKILNAMLNNLELNDNTKVTSNKPSFTPLEREISLKHDRTINLEINNPQRQFTNHNENSNDLIMNDKINNYNFIQKKQYYPS